MPGTSRTTRLTQLTILFDPVPGQTDTGSVGVVNASAHEIVPDQCQGSVFAFKLHIGTVYHLTRCCEPPLMEPAPARSAGPSACNGTQSLEHLLLNLFQVSLRSFPDLLSGKLR